MTLDDHARIPAARRHERVRDRHLAATELFGDTTVRDPRGGVTTVMTLLRRTSELHERLDRDERADRLWHRRIGTWQRVLSRALPVLDLVILTWFLAVTINVDLSTFDPLLLVAVALAVLCTVAVAAWGAVVGEHLRTAKQADRSLSWDAVDGMGRAMLAVSAVVMVALATLMYVRVDDEVRQATGGSTVAGPIVAVTLALSVVVLHVFVLYLSFRDGSAHTTELDRAGRTLRPHLRRRERHLRAARRAEVRGRALEASDRPDRD
ncbi:hypothetical protein [Pseudonocardia sp.]|uniref:hypothetical protein n=1 Tax=Pseudonocardia sp. TaxID=60912 RepID=UPI003D0BBD82